MVNGRLMDWNSRNSIKSTGKESGASNALFVKIKRKRKKGFVMKRKILTIVLTLVMVFSLVPAASVTAHAATSAKTESSAYCTVKISQSLLNKKGKQYAKVKIKTYDMTG